MPRQRPRARLDVTTASDGLRRTVTSGALAPDVWFQLEPPENAPSPDLVHPDFALIALLPMAMKAGYDLDLAFPVDRVLLEGLEHFQDVWHRWRPDVFAEKVEIRAEIVDRVPVASDRAVATFSAGVDSSFTLLRHAGATDWRGRRNLASAVMIHGFDMPLDATAGFARLRSHGARIAEEVGVDFHVMHTNWRDVAPNWQMSFGAGLASVLHQFSGGHRLGLIATEEAYDNAFTIWGNSFWNDRFFSRGDFRLESDGGAFDRIDRITALATRPAMLASLSVCWAGPRSGDNCGTCPKCVLTKLNFTIAGVSDPWPFPQPLTASQVQEMPIKTPWQARFLAIIERRLAEQQKHDTTILDAVRARLARYGAEAGTGAVSALPQLKRRKPGWKRLGERIIQRLRWLKLSRR